MIGRILETKSEKVAAIIPSAGFGKRMGRKIPKQFIEVYGKPIFVYTLEKYASCSVVDEIVLIVPAEEVEKSIDIVGEWNIRKIKNVVAGGIERQDSVRQGFDELSTGIEIVLIHDAVRPFVSIKKIEEIVDSVRKYGAAILAVPEKDTVKRCGRGWVEETLDRNVLWRVQTPQGFKFEWIREAYRKAKQEGCHATDDASLVERLGHRVKIIQGEEKNIKITSPVDLQLAEIFLKEERT